MLSHARVSLQLYTLHIGYICIRKITMMTEKKYETVEFETRDDWRKWLKKNHGKTDGIWLRMYKKDTGIKSVNYQSALEVALCFGWIDGQSNKYDEQSWIQKFTPRRARSMWSARNREIVQRLISEGKMMPAGLKEIEAAKADGRWDQAYDGSGTIKASEDFLKLLGKSKKAAAFFNTLNKANTYAIFWRLATAKKPETRERRLKVIMEMLKKGEKFH